jgi:hypothetical protein
MYLSDDKNLEYIIKATDLSLDELELIVGRFPKDHHNWPGKLKGEYVENWDGEKKILHHFKKTVLWTNK